MQPSLPAPRVWFLALRPFSFTASLVPAIFGSLLPFAVPAAANGTPLRFDAVGFALVALGCVAVHAASNLINDVFDFRRGVDRPDNFGRVNPLVQRTMRPEHVSVEAAAMLALAAACGLALIERAGAARGPLVALVVFGVLSAAFYTAPPLALKNRAIGDLQVLLSFALLMIFGAAYVQSHALSWVPLVDALPIGLLVVDILHINNLRDIDTDRAAGVRTLAIALGPRGAKRLHRAYVAGAFVLLVALVAARLLPLTTLCAFAALPAAKRLDHAVDALGPAAADSLIVVKTARFHALFGALLVAGVLVALV